MYKIVIRRQSLKGQRGKKNYRNTTNVFYIHTGTKTNFTLRYFVFDKTPYFVDESYTMTRKV